MTIARSGMLASVARLETHASNIADAALALNRAAPAPGVDGMTAASPTDLAQEVVGVLEASLLFRANLAVFKAADGMMKRLLDIRA
jgi:flagellar basal body rod protein FlgC